MVLSIQANQGATVTGVVTGKPIELGGSLGRVKASGSGVFLTTLEAARNMGLALDGDPACFVVTESNFIQRS